MNLLQKFSQAWKRARRSLSWSNLRGFVKTPLRGGPSAALAWWRDLSRKTPADDVSHVFQARRYAGSRTRVYAVHLPPRQSGEKPMPLVMVLHGCRQDNRDIERITGFNRLADRHGFLVVYPYITSYRGLRNRNCWGWWFDREIHAGAGEVEDLRQIIEEVRSRYAVDERRIHVAGLSSGAGMAVAMMVAHDDIIASGASVAGVAYAEKADSVVHAMNTEPRYRPVVVIATEMKREMGESSRPVPIQIVHSHDDDKVLIKSAEGLRDSWGYHFGVDLNVAVETRQGEDAGTPWEHRHYSVDGGASLIETFFLEGPGHGWYGGQPGQFSFTEAPDVSQAIWTFFESHPMTAEATRR